MAKPFPTEPRPRVCTLLYTRLVPPVAGLPSLLGLGPSPSLGCSVLPNRLLLTIINSAELGTHQLAVKGWPVGRSSPTLTHPALSPGPRRSLTPPTEHLFMSGMPCSTVDLAGAAAGCGKREGGWQLCRCSPPPAVEVMCLFGLGCCTEKL